MPTRTPQPETTPGRDNDTPANRGNEAAQGVEGRREDELHESGDRIDGPGFGKGSNVV